MSALNLQYIGKTFLNCGPTGEQKSALAADSAFRKTLTASYQTEFTESQGIFNELHGNLEAITAKGASQEGMSAEEKAAENSQAVNRAAAANKNIQAAIGQKAAMSGAVPGVESGVTEAVRGQAMSDVENNLSNEQAKITERNYGIGRENYWAATKGETELPSAMFDPLSKTSKEVNMAESIEGHQADENSAASHSWMGLVGGLANAAVSGLSGGIGSGLGKKISGGGGDSSGG